MAHKRVGELSSLAEVEFAAVPLSTASVVYVSPDIESRDDRALLDDFAAVVADRCDRDASADELKLFHAERYGGVGTGVNGGGARCGNRAGYQVKGIGPNPLVGRDAPADYAHGGYSLSEAIQEAAWGEIAHYALPHGAVRAVAVLATGTPCWWVRDRWGEAIDRQWGVGSEIPRGLLVRPAVLRPAHFLRNMLFDETGNRVANARIDVERVKALAPLLSRELPDAFTSTDGAPTPSADIPAGMSEFVRRLAMQVAASQSLKIAHGALSPSNMSLDGSWLDFGSSTGLPGWGDRAGNITRFWDAGEIAHPIIAEMAHVSRRFGQLDSSGGTLGERLIDVFDRHYRDALSVHFLSLSGIPIDGAKLDPDHQRLSNLIVEACKAGHQLDYDLGHPDESAAFGWFDVGKLFEALSTSAHIFEPLRLSAIVPDAALLDRITDAYVRVRGRAEVAAGAVGVSVAALDRLIRLNASRRRFVPSGFFRHRLVDRVDAMVMADQGADELRVQATDLIVEAARESSVLLSKASPYRVPALDDHNRRVYFDAGLDAWIEQSEGRQDRIFRLDDPQPLRHHQAKPSPVETAWTKRCKEEAWVC